MTKKDPIQLIEDQDALESIYAEIEHRTQAAQQARPIWPCQKGCDLCCRRLAHPPEITAVEWEQLREGMRQLPTSVQEEVYHKVLALREHTEGVVVCPLLDEEAGACRVYAHRPAACRMYGFYVARRHNQWCQQIEELYESGALDGVTFGNYTAVQRQLEQQFGERRSIVAWLLE